MALANTGLTEAEYSEAIRRMGLRPAVPRVASNGYTMHLSLEMEVIPVPDGAGLTPQARANAVRHLKDRVGVN